MKWIVPTPQKLIAFLQCQLGNYSGKALRRLLEANGCRINGRIERFGSRLVQKGDAIELSPHWQAAIVSKPLLFTPVLEDEEFQIVNKPAGWICDPKEAAQTFGPNIHLVHRLYKETTGLLLLAKTKSARDDLMALFEERKVEKTYLALVDGIPKEEGGTRRSFFVKKGSYEGQTIWGSSSSGLEAITKWQIGGKGKGAALLQCKPETGRTHQIRVHLAEMGHPILLDRQYAKHFRCPLFFQRPLLHAVELRFDFKGKAIRAEAPLPQDFTDALRDLDIH